jgi:hypothetical protein
VKKKAETLFSSSFIFHTIGVGIEAGPAGLVGFISHFTSSASWGEENICNRVWPKLV